MYACEHVLDQPKPVFLDLVGDALARRVVGDGFLESRHRGNVRERVNLDLAAIQALAALRFQLRDSDLHPVRARLNDADPFILSP